ncbi:MAG: carboxymuconolactone decarboxylase family protein [Roseivivax sp.]|nr:carboxymuconolactone decarboxylase family protein [Roseivivax sp.]
MTQPPQYPPICDADWPEEIADMLPGFAGGLNVYRTMAHNPALLRAWADLREHVVNRTVLGKQRSEVVILRTGVRLGSPYEWQQHVARARKCGMDDGRILSLRGAPEDMSEEDAILARAVDELFSSHRLSSGSAAAVAGLVGPKGVIDVIATVGFYSTLGYLLNTAGTPLDDDIAAELAAAPLPGET